MSFMHNPIADMYGPTFLWVYGGVTLITLTLCWAWVRAQGAGRSGPLLPVPKDPDPLELAYLRGGAPEVIRLVTFDLTRRGLLEFDPASSASNLKAAPEDEQPSDVSDIEGIVLRAFRAPHRPEEPLRNGGIVAAIEEHFVAVRQRLEREGLLSGPGAETSAYAARVVGTLIIVGLGGYKLTVALLKGKTNVGFLILMGIAGAVILFRLCRPRRWTSKARAYLERLQAAFRPPPLGTSWRAGSSGAASTSAAAVASAFGKPPPPPDEFESLLPLLVAVHGMHILTGSAYGYFPALYARPVSTSPGTSWWGSSCGSSWSCGAGSSCGSSCGGGGGCGGGGCGGCGGGN